MEKIPLFVGYFTIATIMLVGTAISIILLVDLYKISHFTYRIIKAFREEEIVPYNGWLRLVYWSISMERYTSISGKGTTKDGSKKYMQICFKDYTIRIDQKDY